MGGVCGNQKKKNLYTTPQKDAINDLVQPSFSNKNNFIYHKNNELTINTVKPNHLINEEDYIKTISASPILARDVTEKVEIFHAEICLEGEICLAGRGLIQDKTNNNMLIALTALGEVALIKKDESGLTIIYKKKFELGEPDSRNLITSSQDSLLLIAGWDNQLIYIVDSTLNPKTNFNMHEKYNDKISSARFLNANNVLIGFSRGRFVTVNINANTEIHDQLSLTGISAIAVGLQETEIFLGTFKGDLIFFDLVDMDVEWSVQNHQNVIWCINLLNDSKVCVTGGQDGFLVMQSMLTGNIIEKINVKFSILQFDWNTPFNKIVLLCDSQIIVMEKDNDWIEKHKITTENTNRSMVIMWEKNEVIIGNSIGILKIYEIPLLKQQNQTKEDFAHYKSFIKGF